jgi:negative regulator of flagellin synthesis FlgM
MPNKISGLSPSPLQEAVPIPGAGAPGPGAVPGRSPLGGSAAETSSPAPGGDVHITDSASQLASLEQAVRGLPAVDPARVAQFRTALEQGTYTVQPQHVADQLMQLEQALEQLPEG